MKVEPKSAPGALIDCELLCAIGEHLLAPEPIAPAASERVFARLRRRLDLGQGVQTFRAAHGDWRVLRDRVYLKVLKRDATTGLASYLVRYLAGGRVERHPQRYVEECMLVSGDLRIDDIDMQVGDLQFAHPGGEHGPLSTVHGALVFVRGILKTVPEQRAPGD